MRRMIGMNMVISSSIRTVQLSLMEVMTAD